MSDGKRFARWLLVILPWLGPIGASSCGTESSETDFTLTSSSSSDGFDPDGTIAAVYACSSAGGSDELPTLSWSNPPNGTLSYAITVIDTTTDPDTIHAVLFNIASSATSVDDEDDFNSTNSCINYNNASSYAGPCPPSGEEHTYVFTIYALEVADLVDDAEANVDDAEDCIEKIKDKDLDSDSISGKFTGP